MRRLPPTTRLAPAILVWMLVGAGVLPAYAEEATAGAATVVDDFHATLLGTMQEAEALGYAGREEQLRPAVLGAFDLVFMGRKTLGRHWKELGEEDQTRFLATFERLSVANYAGRFTGWSGESFEALGAEPGVHGTVVVKTRLVVPDDDPIQLDYRLHRNDAGWQIIDVYMDGTISELALRRSEYGALLKRESFPALIEALDSKIAKLEEGDS